MHYMDFKSINVKRIKCQTKKRGVDGGTNGGLLATREEDTKMKENNSSKRVRERRRGRVILNF